MKSFLSFGSFIILAVAVGWYYMPEDTRNSTVAFIASIFEGDVKSVPDFTRKIFLRDSPEKQKETLIQDLRANLGKIRLYSENKNATPETPPLAELIVSSENILEKIEDLPEISNSDKITDKILKSVFSSRQPETCREDNK